MTFRKALAEYYPGWYTDCINSAEYCKHQGQYDLAAYYLKRAKDFKEILDNFPNAIAIFSIGDNAFLKDSAIPQEFRNYE
jgi:hypothetical protein